MKRNGAILYKNEKLPVKIARKKEKIMSKMKELQDAMIAAMKAKDKFRKDAISVLVSAAKKSAPIAID